MPDLPTIPDSLDFVAPRMRIVRDAAAQRSVTDRLVRLAAKAGFAEIGLPTIEPAANYAGKIGDEMTGQMFRLAGDDNLVLRPEGTATLQLLAKGPWKSLRDIRVFYVARCFRHERPQKGRYREFTQFGAEILNPRDPFAALGECMTLAKVLARDLLGYGGFQFHESVERGLSYYTDRRGFEIRVPSLGAVSQVCGGGAYAEGVGFAFGIDRLAMAQRAGVPSPASDGTQTPEGPGGSP